VVPAKQRRVFLFQEAEKLLGRRWLGKRRMAGEAHRYRFGFYRRAFWNFINPLNSSKAPRRR